MLRPREVRRLGKVSRFLSGSIHCSGARRSERTLGRAREGVTISYLSREACVIATWWGCLLRPREVRRLREVTFFQLHRLPSWGQLRGCERRREGLCSSLRATAYFNTRAHDSPRAAEGHLESA